MDNELPVPDISYDPYDSISFRVPAPEGKFTIFFDEDRKTHKLVRIAAFAGKSGSYQAAWLDAFCRIISRQLEKDLITLEEIEEVLSSTRSDHVYINSSGVECSSGPEAIFIAIQQYKNEKFAMLRRQLGYSNEGDPRFRKEG